MLNNIFFKNENLKNLHIFFQKAKIQLLEYAQFVLNSK